MSLVKSTLMCAPFIFTSFYNVGFYTLSSRLDREDRSTLQGPFRTSDLSGVLRQGAWFWRRESSDNWLVGQGGFHVLNSQKDASLMLLRKDYQGLGHKCEHLCISQAGSSPSSALSKTKAVISSTLAHSDFVKTLLIVPSLQLLVSCSSDKSVRFWSVALQNLFSLQRIC
jgi:WD40 repeat protein